jgi:hypothetical protein
MRVAPVLIVVLAALALPLAAAAGGGAGGGADDPTFGYGPQVREARAIHYCDGYNHRPARHRACLQDQLLRLIVETRNPARELPRIDRYAHAQGGFLEAACHVLMHGVGRRYGRLEHVTLARLQDYLPRTNDPGCSAGFGHGLLMALGPQLVQDGPRRAAAECNLGATRYRRYSCIHGLGHAYMRLYSELLPPALAACRSLGPVDAPDCGQGAFHDYWIALSGLDSTHHPTAAVSPRQLCGRQPAIFVRACWFRAFLERPPRRAIASAADVSSTCDGLVSLQRSGCVTAASLVAAVDPFDQLAVCSRLTSAADAASCVRGVRAQGVAGTPLAYQVRLVQRCVGLVRAARRACYTWMGRALNVVADGRFAARGCSRLLYPATRAACASGARAYVGPLETFS